MDAVFGWVLEGDLDLVVVGKTDRRVKVPEQVLHLQSRVFDEGNMEVL